MPEFKNSPSSIHDLSTTMSAAISPSPIPLKDQYHHYIPRFVLRRYQPEGAPQFASAKKRNQAIQQARKKGNELEKIYVYDFPSESFDTLPIAKTYGTQNLYRDVKDPEDANYLEEKFSTLENTAAEVINIVHKTIENGTGIVTLKRSQADSLRKFLFLMHYRLDNLSKTYFDKNHPDNAPARDWIAKFVKDHGLATDVEAWIYGLRYFLDTPHSQIIQDAYKHVEKWGITALSKMMSTRVDPDVENFYTIAYFGHARSRFLCIWEAADGMEFVLTNVSFGLWEGLIMGVGGAHRLFTISPRIVLVLVHTFLRPDRRPPGIHLDSNFKDIPLNTPISNYRDGSLLTDDVTDDVTAFMKYTTSPAAANDEFYYRVTKLSPNQTFEVNRVFLKNVGPEGRLTFSSKEKVLPTLRRYLEDPPTFNDVQHTIPKFKKLVSYLSADLTGSRDPSSAAVPPAQASLESSSTKSSMYSFLNSPIAEEI
ncbi:hypothetical protein Hypma_004916 [Hypsizygus marmoreus]|uniref:DUF4238 domain-containing protein n=1 Tax=Hypsizygus marmoreus TaxID=39966 RepID=A0A369K8I0_HYPMA|nr:hypothetical protein Hypma_004916 [Hypsizygus marmoreus]